ncbi:MAG TPA: sugar porter family MFS transporter [Phycisphaerae bacterium]|nr:sugar porter family MFS transporter [Phycisphaerae bacterium]HRY67549.1 sugar porter family MFS transporter [Phycisphaerae bacterium]HSA24936.1 sugar porter family MFS transporter [Phycisphaerae bacterium]
METHQQEGNASYVFLLVVVAAMGGLLFGYDTAVISGAIGFLQQHFELDELQKGWAASCALVGCILGAAGAGVLSDWAGRKKVMLLAAGLFSVSAIGAAIPVDLTTFVVARVLGGIGIGVASMTSPLYIAEISPARARGRLVSVNQFAIISGMLVVYFVNTLIARSGDEHWNITQGWRWMFASGLAPAVVFGLLVLLIPESPRWLTKRGRSEEALAVLTRVGGTDRARAELAEIKDAIAHEGSAVALLLRPEVRAPLVIGVVLAVLQQVTGINVVLYYAPEIFKSAGMETSTALNNTVIVGVVNLAFTVVAIWVVDRVGRRPLLLATSIGMGVSLTLLGGAFVLGRLKGPGVLVFVLSYVASFAVAMGPVVWVVMSEIFPTRIRGVAMSIATVCLWVSCFAVSQFFPLMLAWLAGYVFFVYAAMCAVAVMFVLLYVPETKGKSLEQIERGWVPRSGPEVTVE